MNSREMQLDLGNRRGGVVAWTKMEMGERGLRNMFRESGIGIKMENFVFKPENPVIDFGQKFWVIPLVARLREGYRGPEVRNYDGQEFWVIEGKECRVVNLPNNVHSRRDLSGIPQTSWDFIDEKKKTKEWGDFWNQEQECRVAWIMESAGLKVQRKIDLTGGLIEREDRQFSVSIPAKDPILVIFNEELGVKASGINEEWAGHVNRAAEFLKLGPNRDAYDLMQIQKKVERLAKDSVSKLSNQLNLGQQKIVLGAAENFYLPDGFKRVIGDL